MPDGPGVNSNLGGGASSPIVSFMSRSSHVSPAWTRNEGKLVAAMVGAKQTPRSIPSLPKNACPGQPPKWLGSIRGNGQSARGLEQVDLQSRVRLSGDVRVATGVAVSQLFVRRVERPIPVC